MIPKSCRLFGRDHAEDNYDPQKSLAMPLTSQSPKRVGSGPLRPSTSLAGLAAHGILPPCLCFGESTFRRLGALVLDRFHTHHIGGLFAGVQGKE